MDPPGCKDIDDALHARPLPGGNLELGVHIADVTHFLAPGTAMDVEASSRRAPAGSGSAGTMVTRHIAGFVQSSGVEQGRVSEPV